MILRLSLPLQLVPETLIKIEYNRMLLTKTGQTRLGLTLTESKESGDEIGAQFFLRCP